jgi:cell division transport system permease protein
MSGFEKPGSIIPRSAAPLRSLIAVMTVMCFLAVLAVGAMLLINRAVAQWASGLSSEATVQLPQLSTRDMEADLSALTKLLEDTKGVKAVTILERSEGEKLLVPWIGAEGLDSLPIPRLLRVVVNDKAPPDFVKLEEALQRAVPTARLDTHRRWEAELQRMASSLTLLMFCTLLVLMMISLPMPSTGASLLLAQLREFWVWLVGC